MTMPENDLFSGFPGQRPLAGFTPAGPCEKMVSLEASFRSRRRQATMGNP
jgi:hypothetical protein